MVDSTVFLRSHYHVPEEHAQGVFISVLRAGHIKAAPDYRIERRVCAGDDILFCLRGQGHIRIHGREYHVGPGQLGWIGGAHPHAHWAEPSHPWELLWLRLDGVLLPAVARLLRVDNQPVFTLPKPAEAECILRRILRRFLRPNPVLDAVLNADVAALLACLFLARRRDVGLMYASAADRPSGINRAIEQLSVYYYRQWAVDDAARIAGLGAVQFFRSFRKATGMTPMQYLRRQRMNIAQRRLVETSDSVKEIAEQVGYLDRFHFSREFKRWTGLSPKSFRARELGTGNHRIQSNP